MFSLIKIGRKNGFTLLELLIAMAIISIIAAFAMPSLYDYSRRAHVADANSALALLASQLESNYLDKRRYSTNSNECDVAIPTDIEEFTLACSIPNGDPDQFQLSATSTEDFYQGMQYVFNLNEKGNRSTQVIKNSSVIRDEDCWILSEKGACQ